MKMSFNKLVYECASDKFREIVDRLEENRIKNWNVQEYGILCSISYTWDGSLLIATREGRWAAFYPVEDHDELVINEAKNALDFLVENVHCNSVVKAGLLTQEERSLFSEEYWKAHQVALEHQEREQLRKLREKYPDEVSQ
jgi:hypothetical protein